jgi:hypothetical protein
MTTTNLPPGGENGFQVSSAFLGEEPQPATDSRIESTTPPPQADRTWHRILSFIYFST